MDFYKDLEDIIQNRLNKLGITVKYSKVDELLRNYLNIKFKMIEIKPYKVHYSSELASKVIKEPYATILEKIKDKLENGNDINPHLSKKSMISKEPDGLLYDWNIYHLHLNEGKKHPSDFFYKRSGCLLFLLVKNDDIYFIDVRSHSEKLVWVKKELFKVVERNWNHLVNGDRFDSLKSAEEISEQDRYDLRRKGAMTFTEGENGVFMPIGGGVAARGGSIKVISRANFILRNIGTMQEEIKNNPDNIKKTMQKNGIAIPEKLDFKLIEGKKGQLLYLEKNTKFSIGSDIYL